MFQFNASLRTLTLGALLLMTPIAGRCGNVSGKALFEGAERPKRTEIKMDADPKCKSLHEGKRIGTEDFLITSEGQIKNVFVYVTKGLEGKKFEVPKTAALIDQNGCMYSPHVLGLMVGQKLDIKNSDQTLHNIHCLSKINPEFNFGQPTPSVRTKDFRKVEEGLKLKCDVHPWMAAWLFVLDHPYFAVTEADGSFTIKDLPAGSYELTAWHEKLGVVKAPLEVKDADVSDVNFTFKPKEKIASAQ